MHAILPVRRGKNGAPEEIRTPDPQIRSLVLYPAELRVRFEGANLFRTLPKGKDHRGPTADICRHTPRIPAKSRWKRAISAPSGIVLPCPPRPCWLRLDGQGSACRKGGGRGWVLAPFSMSAGGGRAWRRAAESMMRGIPAKHRLKKSLFLAFALTAGLGLAACSDIDSMFGDDSGGMPTPPRAQRRRCRARRRRSRQRRRQPVRRRARPRSPPSPR